LGGSIANGVALGSTTRHEGSVIPDSCGKMNISTIFQRARHMLDERFSTTKILNRKQRTNILLSWFKPSMTLLMALTM
jgi:hypothetical protein